MHDPKTSHRILCLNFRVCVNVCMFVFVCECVCVSVCVCEPRYCNICLNPPRVIIWIYKYCLYFPEATSISTFAWYSIVACMVVCLLTCARRICLHLILHFKGLTRILTTGAGISMAQREESKHMKGHVHQCVHVEFVQNLYNFVCLSYTVGTDTYWVRHCAYLNLVINLLNSTVD